jgi:N-acetylglucosamine kinase-like BadF-type ATPase
MSLPPDGASAGPYFLGVDIGGTKSHALVADARGEALGFGEGGPGNYEVVGYEGMTATLREITHAALDDAGLPLEALAGAGLGVAGYDWPSEREPILKAIEAVGLPVPFALVNDTVIALLAGAQGGWGVVVVAGTSNNCRGWDRERREGRLTGSSVLMGEYGGASELVFKAVHAVSAHWGSRGPATRLTDVFVELTGAASVDALIEGLCLGRITLRADVAPVVFRVAAEGDPVARELVEWTGRELAGLALGVIRQLSFEALAFDVVLSGSVFNGSPRVAEVMGEVVRATAPRARLVRLECPPVVGGVLLALEDAGVDPQPSRARLIRSTRELLEARLLFGEPVDLTPGPFPGARPDPS